MQLTPTQQKAVQSVGYSTAIIAGAGSGKTEVLTGRLLYLLKEKGLTLSQILCVTFTEKAALEMKHRIAQQVTAELKKEIPWAAIGTFHSICLGILKEQAPLLGLPPLFSVWDEATAKLEIHRACRQTLLDALQEKIAAALLLVETLEFRHALLLLEELMQFRWHWEKIAISSQLSAVNEQTLFDATKKLYQQTLKNYEDKKTQRQALDFQDLEILTLKLIKENQAVRQAYQNRFQHILVDEAQDINDCQQELLQLLWNPALNKLCIVGDPKQSIYRFRGANVEGFLKMVEKITKAGGKKITLVENFRSRLGILELINHTFRSLMDPQIYSPLIPTRESTAKPNIEVLAVNTEPSTSTEVRRKQEAKALTTTIQAEVETGQAQYQDFALLFQSLTEVRHYEAMFRQYQIPYRLSGGRGFLSAQEVLDCLFVLKILECPQDRLAAVGLMRSPFLSWPDTRITELCLENPIHFLPVITKQPEAAWLKTLAEEKENLSSAEILEQAIHATQYDALLARLDPSGGKLANVEQLISLIRELETAEQLSPASILEYFETLKKRNAPIASAPAVDTTLSACQLMTVHQAKGLQFPIVILPDLLHGLPSDTHRYLFSRKEGLGFYLRENDSPLSGFVPSQTVLQLKEKESLQELNERKRLLYVAMTRAQEKLIIPLHEGGGPKALWHQWLQEALETTRLPVVKKSGDTILNSQIVAAPSPSELSIVSPDLKLVPQPEPIRYLTVTDLEKGLRPLPRETHPQHQPAELSGEVTGNLVHAVFKNLHQTKQLPLEQLVRKEALNLNLGLSFEQLKELAQMIERFLNSDLAPPWEKGRHEIPFRLKSNGVVITGVIDYLIETPQGWVIYDFKTDRQFQPEKYQLQMDAYALALSERQRVEGLARPVLETQLLYLRLGKAHVEKWDHRRQIRAETELKQAINP